MPHLAMLLTWALATPVAEVLYTQGRAHEGADSDRARASFERLVHLGERLCVPHWAALGRARLVRPLVRAARWEELEALAPVLLGDVELVPAGEAAALLDMLGTLACRRLEWERALPLRVRAARLAADLTPTQRAFYGARAAQVLLNLGHTAEAWAELEPCLVDAAAEGVAPMARARAELVAALALRDLGRLTEARARIDDLLARGDARPAQQVEALQLLCDLDIAQGRLEDLERHASRLAVWHDQGVGLGELANTRHAQAWLALLRGEFPLARRELDAAIEACGDPLRAFEMRLTRAQVLERVDDVQRAADEGAALVALAEELGGTSRLQRALLVHGRLLRKSVMNPQPGQPLVPQIARQWARAQLAAQRYAQAARLAEEGGRVLSLAVARAGLAAVALLQQDLDQARSHLGPALAVLRARGETLNLTAALTTATRLALEERHWDEARTRLAEAERLHEGLLGAGMDPLEFGRLRSRVAGWADLHQEIAVRSGALDEGFAAAGRWKARALLAGLERRGSCGDGAPLVEGLRAQLDGRLLVEYAPGLEHLYAYVLDADGLTRLDLGGFDEIARLVWRYVRGISAPPLLDAAQVAELGGALHARLVAPVLAGRAAPAGLVIVPPLPRRRQPLASLPFEALVVRAAQDVRGFADVTFLLDEVEVTYGPSSEALLALAEAPDPSGTRTLIVGDPDFGALGDEPGVRGAGRWPRLRGTRREALDLARRLLPLDDAGALGRHRELDLGQQRDVAFETGHLDLFLGRAAHSSLFERVDLARYRWVHVAAHGLYDRDDPRRTALVLSDGPALDLARVRALELDAQLVVLSACETASGEALGAEGIQSMALGFLEAGARNVVASHWLVEDQAAQDLMHEFYRRMLAGATPAQALTGARRALRADASERGVRPRRRDDVVEISGAHPYRWAPFVLLGWGAESPGLR